MIVSVKPSFPKPRLLVEDGLRLTSEASLVALMLGKLGVEGFRVKGFGV